MLQHKIKKGDKVVMAHSGEGVCDYEGKIWEVITEPYKMHPTHKFEVVFLRGYRSAYCTDFLVPVDVSHYEKRIEKLTQCLEEQIQKMIKKLEAMMDKACNENFDRYIKETSDIVKEWPIETQTIIMNALSDETEVD